MSTSRPRNPLIFTTLRGFQFADSQITVPAGTTTFLLYNAQLIITNSVFATNLVTLDGLTTNGYGNSLAFYNAQASLKNTNVFGDGPLTLADSILTISNNFMLFPSTVLNYTLDPNTNRVAVVGNLALGGTINVTNGTGFGAGTNILLTYTGTLSGNLPALGSTPAGYNYAFNTNTDRSGETGRDFARAFSPDQFHGDGNEPVDHFELECRVGRDQLQSQTRDGQRRALPCHFQRHNNDQLFRRGGDQRCDVLLRRHGGLRRREHQLPASQRHTAAFIDTDQHHRASRQRSIATFLATGSPWLAAANPDQQFEH